MNNVMAHSEKLPYFHQVVKSGSILKASMVLGIAQPALSHSMKLLENALGVSLFIRSRSGVELTRDGKLLYDFYCKIKDDADALELSLSSAKKTEEDFLEVTVGTHESLVNNFWPILVREIKKRKLRIKPSLYTEFSTLALSEKLLNGTLDALISVDRNKFKLPSINYTNIKRDHYNFFVAKDYLPGKKIIKRKDLDSLPFVFLPNTIAGNNEILEDVLEKNEMKIKSTQNLSTFESVKSVVMNGLGVGILPNQICDFEVGKKLLRTIKVEDVDITSFGPHSFSYCYRNTKKEASRLKEFSDLVIELF